MSESSPTARPTNRVRPTRRAVIVAALGMAVALVPSILSPGLWTVWVAFVGVLVLAAGVDLLLAPTVRDLEIELMPPEVLYIADADPARLRLRTVATAPETTVEVRADLGPLLEPWEGARLVARPAEPVALDVPLVPHRRGRATIDAIWFRWSGPLGLLARVRRVPVGASIPVVPDVRSVERLALLSLATPESWAGLKQVRHVGEGSEFESLREYLPGFDHRSMDWKASARHRKLLVREHRAERDQSLVLAVDTGHLMAEPVAGVPRLDRAVNASLHLALVGLRTGDRVGMFAFDSRVRGFREPASGISTFPHLLRFSSDLEYSTEETNFTLGLLDLSGRLRRRTLIVLLTDFVDTITAELMLENIGRLSRRHLVLAVTLRDPRLDGVVTREPLRLDDVHRAVVARDLVRERQVVHRRLRRLGVHVVDAAPGAVTSRLLNRYLEIKRRELVG